MTDLEWPTVELAQRQVTRYETQLASLTVATPPEAREAVQANLAHWQRRLAELLGGDGA